MSSNPANPGGTILLLESDPQMRQGIAEQLLADGYRVELACSAAHARALADRAGQAPAPGSMLEIGSLTIDMRARSVCVGGRTVALRPLEFELLAHLARDARRVCAKDELLRAVWGYRADGSTRTVDTHASRLRRKLDLDGEKRWVVNVWGVGYRLL